VIGVAVLSVLENKFRAAITSAFGDEHAAIPPAIRRSQHSDYQANCALGLASRLKQPPRAVAESIVKHLDLAGMAESIDVSGPGYVNIKLDSHFLAAALAEMATDPRRGIDPSPAPETIVVDYSSPNVAKELHVGHLRGTILGDALCRVLECLGHRVIRQNHLGDWGTPFGMLIEAMKESSADSLSSVKNWNTFYRQARTKFEADSDFADRSRKSVVALQALDPEALALWHQLMSQSRRYLATIYAKLGVSLTDADVAGESIYNPMLASVVSELRARNLVTESDGALCVFLPSFQGKTGDPLPLIIQKQDAGYGYATTDLAAIRYRLQNLGATRILYVVGAAQRLHLQMIFATAREAGWLVPPLAAEHVDFAAVLGADRKMFKTRSGDTVSLASLLDEAVARAETIVAQKNPGLGAEARADVARKIGIGSIKYADLSTDRVKDYVFDWDRMLAFEGNTAPYLQYAYARIRSIFHRAQAPDLAPRGSFIVIREPAERALALELLDFHAAVAQVAESLQPHKLCTYLFSLATAFSGFYEQCPIVQAATDDERRSRLALAGLTAVVLARGLELLGIEVPEQM
jgi:arginyl-tRNA synthetase